MDVMKTISTASEALTVQRVFGEPFEKDGVTVIPVARIGGGAGGGDGEGPEGEGHGSGGGFGLGAKPAGVFVLSDGEVTWRPAVDVNRVILGGQLVGVVALLVVRSILRSRSNR
jgi:uncharacterized spore protein YtfJ